MDAYLTPSRWYMQTFGEPSPEHLFFKGDTTLKNGRMQGTMVTLDLTRPRAKPRAKRVCGPPAARCPPLETGRGRRCSGGGVPCMGGFQQADIR